MICLVKPLFEVEDSEIRRTGVIDSPSVYFEVLHDLAQYVSSIGYSVRGITHSHVTGNNGTREFFLWISLSAEQNQAIDLHGDIQRAVHHAVNLPQFR